MTHSPLPNESSTREALQPDANRGEADEDLAEIQAYVDRLLSRAIIYSIFWVAGAGSLYSVILAAKAHRILREHPGKLYGLPSVVLCYLLGGAGILLVGGVLTMVLLNG